MAGGGAQPTKGTAEVGAAKPGVRKRGRRCPYLCKDLRGGGPGSFFVWVGDVSNDTTHWYVLGRISPQGGLQDDGKATDEGGWC